MPRGPLERIVRHLWPPLALALRLPDRASFIRSLGVHGHFRSVQALVQCCGDEAGNVANSGLSRARKQIDEPRLVLWSDGKHVDDRQCIAAW